MRVFLLFIALILIVGCVGMQPEPKPSADDRKINDLIRSSAYKEAADLIYRTYSSKTDEQEKWFRRIEEAAVWHAKRREYLEAGQAFTAAGFFYQVVLNQDKGNLLLEQAITNFKKGIESFAMQESLYYRAAECYKGLADLYLAWGIEAETVFNFEKALEFYPQSMDIYLALFKPSVAAVYIQHAYEICLYLAKYKKEHKDIEAARPLLFKALDFAALYSLLANAVGSELGLESEARRELELLFKGNGAYFIGFCYRELDLIEPANPDYKRQAIDYYSKAKIFYGELSKYYRGINDMQAFSLFAAYEQKCDKVIKELKTR